MRVIRKAPPRQNFEEEGETTSFTLESGIVVGVPKEVLPRFPLSEEERLRAIHIENSERQRYYEYDSPRRRSEESPVGRRIHHNFSPEARRRYRSRSPRVTANTVSPSRRHHRRSRRSSSPYESQNDDHHLRLDRRRLETPSPPGYDDSMERHSRSRRWRKRRSSDSSSMECRDKRCFRKRSRSNSSAWSESDKYPLSSQNLTSGRSRKSKRRNHRGRNKRRCSIDSSTLRNVKGEFDESSSPKEKRSKKMELQSDYSKSSSSSDRDKKRRGRETQRRDSDSEDRFSSSRASRGSASEEPRSPLDQGGLAHERGWNNTESSTSSSSRSPASPSKEETNSRNRDRGGFHEDFSITMEDKIKIDAVFQALNDSERRLLQSYFIKNLKLAGIDDYKGLMQHLRTEIGLDKYRNIFNSHLSSPEFANFAGSHAWLTTILFSTVGYMLLHSQIDLPEDVLNLLTSPCSVKVLGGISDQRWNFMEHLPNAYDNSEQLLGDTSAPLSEPLDLSIGPASREVSTMAENKNDLTPRIEKGAGTSRDCQDNRSGLNSNDNNCENFTGGTRAMKAVAKNRKILKKYETHKKETEKVMQMMDEGRNSDLENPRFKMRSREDKESGNEAGKDGHRSQENVIRSRENKVLPSPSVAAPRNSKSTSEPRVFSSRRVDKSFVPDWSECRLLPSICGETPKHHQVKQLKVPMSTYRNWCRPNEQKQGLHVPTEPFSVLVEEEKANRDRWDVLARFKGITLRDRKHQKDDERNLQDEMTETEEDVVSAGNPKGRDDVQTQQNLYGMIASDWSPENQVPVQPEFPKKHTSMTMKEVIETYPASHKVYGLEWVKSVIEIDDAYLQKKEKEILSREKDPKGWDVEFVGIFLAMVQRERISIRKSCLSQRDVDLEYAFGPEVEEQVKRNLNIFVQEASTSGGTNTKLSAILKRRDPVSFPFIGSGGNNHRKERSHVKEALQPT